MEALRREEPTGQRSPAHGPQEAAADEAVPVEEHEVVAARLERPEVAVASLPPALVRLPDVPQTVAEGLLPALDDRGGLGPGAVVGDDDLERGVVLVGERPQGEVERLGPLVRDDDDADEPGRRSPAHSPRKGEASFSTSGPRRYFSSFQLEPRERTTSICGLTWGRRTALVSIPTTPRRCTPDSLSVRRGSSGVSGSRLERRRKQTCR